MSWSKSQTFKAGKIFFFFFKVFKEAFILKYGQMTVIPSTNLSHTHTRNQIFEQFSYYTVLSSNLVQKEIEECCAMKVMIDKLQKQEKYEISRTNCVMKFTASNLDIAF